MKGFLGRLLFGAGILMIGVSSLFFWENDRERREVEDTYEELREAFYEPEKTKPEEEKEASRQSSNEQPQEKRQEASSKKEEEPAVDWQGLKQWNSSIVAWVEIPGTNLNYPVVQGENNEFYLSHTIDGQASDYGAIFLGWEHSGTFTDAVSFLYGHNMLDGAMFALLNRYEEPEFYRDHPVFWIQTPREQRMYRIFSVYQAQVAGEGFAYDYVLGTEAYKRHLQYIQEQSLYPIDGILDGNQPMVTLVTCNTRLQEEVRLTVHGILTEP